MTLPDERGHFGPYGGRFVPETLVPALEELTAAWTAARGDPSFQAELEDLLRRFAGRPTPLGEARRMADTGSHRDPAYPDPFAAGHAVLALRLVERREGPLIAGCAGCRVPVLGRSATVPPMLIPLDVRMPLARIAVVSASSVMTGGTVSTVKVRVLP